MGGGGTAGQVYGHIGCALYDGANAGAATTGCAAAGSTGSVSGATGAVTGAFTGSGKGTGVVAGAAVATTAASAGGGRGGNGGKGANGGCSNGCFLRLRLVVLAICDHAGNQRTNENSRSCKKKETMTQRLHRAVKMLTEQRVRHEKSVTIGMFVLTRVTEVHGRDQYVCRPEFPVSGNPIKC